jgi:hypothetical protein
LTNSTEHQQDPQHKNPDATWRKTALVIVIACLGIVVAAVAMNFDRLSASGTTEQESEAPVAPNTAPAIIGLTPATDRIAPLDVCNIVCEAGDVDGDALTYTWTADQGEFYGEGKSIKWGAPEVEGLFRVSVAVDDGRGGIAEQSVSLRVKQNYAPEIESLSASPERVEPGASTYISCSATDADGDEVSYEWEAPYGELFGQGDSISWLAPEKPGSYVVTVYALDAYGGTSTRNVLINVSPADAPELGDFVVEPIDHTMLKFEHDVWDIFIGRSCSVECVILEGEEPFIYAWSVDVGNLTADGSATATWEAPERRGPATITVEVTDINGNTTVGVLLMYAEDCTCAF